MSGKNIDMLTMIPKLTGWEWKDLRVCQLGNQFVKGGRTPTIGKDYLEQVYGAKEVVVIDLYDHPFDYIYPLDLGKPIDKWHGYFDIVTNFGTSEHVWNQYQVFKNIHNFLKKGGLAIHCVPIKPIHGGVCYSEDFFGDLAKENKYQVVFKEWWGGKEIKITLKKETDRKFFLEGRWKGSIYLDKMRGSNINGL